MFSRHREVRGTGAIRLYDTYAPLFARLTPDASEKFRKANYVRLFDEARQKVRAWERTHLKETPQ